MKTETLIELQRSITQGEWRLNNCQRTGMALIEDSKGGDIAICDEGFPQYNARAISLVPELIAEVIRLRIALGLIVNECSEQQVTENAIVTSRPSLLCLEQCRAALANDK